MSKKEEKVLEALSPTEQKVYSELYSKRVVNTDDVREILGKSHRSVDYITNLRKKGYFQKIKKGVYAVVPPDLIGEDFNSDKFLVAGKVKNDYYISHHSALELHGMAQSTYNRVWISTKNPAKHFDYKSISYRFVTTKYFFGDTEVSRQGIKIRVSDREKTFLDCIRMIKYTGGLEELMKSLNNFPALDWDKLLGYLKKFEEAKLHQKTGFILDRLDLRVPEEVREKLSRGVSKRTYYLDENRDSRHVKEWNLMVPQNFEELV